MEPTIFEPRLKFKLRLKFLKFGLWFFNLIKRFLELRYGFQMLVILLVDGHLIHYILYIGHFVDTENILHFFLGANLRI